MSEVIAENKVATLAYEIWVDDELLETVTVENAIEYLHGWDNIVPGLEKALEGKVAGDTFDITVPPEEGYGDYDDELIEEIDRSDFDFEEESVQIEIGMEVEMLDEEGDIIEGTIVGIEDDVVLVDMNPPLAGKTIRYAGEVISVREANEDELDWGFPESLMEELFGEEDDWDEEDEEDYEDEE
jgi:FKBP-type peptidyl-prolyl cis-trans isomerase SlyD